MLGKPRDPVCGAKVTRSTRYRYSLKGKVFFFDSAACRQTFLHEPERFLGRRKKGLIESLAEESDGQPKSCH